VNLWLVLLLVESEWMFSMVAAAFSSELSITLFPFLLSEESIQPFL
jgi:hypothetical protein